MIYKIVDASDDEANFTLAYYTDKEKAIALSNESPECWDSPWEHEDYARLEVRECEEGWGMQSKTIKTAEWENVYDESIDDSVWVIKD